MEPITALFAICLLIPLLAFPVWTIRCIRRLQEEIRALKTLRPPPAMFRAEAPRPEPAPSLPAAVLTAPAVPPPVLRSPPPPSPLPRPESRQKNWEQFMGARLFAWLGGFALFLAVGYAIKYSFDHELISPAVRVILGELLGLGLIAGGLLIPRPRYRITAQTLVGAGVVSLYAVTYACDAIYHFPFFGAAPTFIALGVITAGACLLALWMGAPVVALLGVLAGYLTPFLIHTGQDNPAGLFGYIGLLAAGLIAMGLGRRWTYLIPISAAGTLLMIAVWAGEFYAPGQAGTAVIICLGFCALYFGGYLAGRSAGRADPMTLSGALALPAFALGFAVVIARGIQSSSPAPLLLLLLGANLFLLALAGLDRRLAPQLGLLWALAGTWAAENLWHFAHLQGIGAGQWLGWLLASYALFTVYPFCLRRRFERLTIPWAVAALSGPVHFGMIYQACRHAWTLPFPGLIPAAFALPPLAGFALLRRSAGGPAPDEGPRPGQLAWFGGVVLFFIVLIIPIQFHDQWIDIGWCLEGIGLLWLFHRLPHPGLRAAGCGLLLLVAARLILFPGVLNLLPGTGSPIFNRYLYTYGGATLGLFLGARLLAPPRDRVLDVSAPALLSIVGTVLAFVLLNVEIADYFTPAYANTPILCLNGDFGQDLSYTVGWALFALALLSMGIWQRQRSVRIAAIVLLGATLVKLYFHDLARLEALYRIAALFAVALIAILASVFYQRFVPGAEGEEASKARGQAKE